MNWHQRFINIALILAEGSKCVKLKVGCIIVKNNRIISSGVNGTPNGYTNCCDKFPNGINTNKELEEHHIWSKLNEIHAEMNAILATSKKGISIIDSSIYITHFPCSECLKNIIQLGIKKIYFFKYHTFEDIGRAYKYAKKNNVKIFRINKFGELDENIKTEKKDKK